MDELDVESVAASAEQVVLNAKLLWSQYDLKRRCTCRRCCSK